MMPRSARLDRITRAIDDPPIRAMFEEYKRLVGLAAERHDAGDEPGHVAASTDAVRQAGIVIAALPAGLPDRETFRVLWNLAMGEMLPEHPLGIARPAFTVRVPRGRSAGARGAKRAELIRRLQSQPSITDAELVRLGQEIADWPADDQDDYDARRKRIGRARHDAGQ